MNARLFTWCLREICRQCYEFNHLCHMCAYSAILQLKIINNKSIEAIELSKIPRDKWERVALSEIIPRTDFGRGDVVQQPPISRSYLGCWAYRIYIYIYIDEWSDCYDYIYIFPRAGADNRWNLIFFSFFLISYSQHCLKICISCFLFLNIFSIQTPLWLSLNSLDNNIFTWYFPFEIMNICHFLTIILSSETGWSDAHTLLNAA